MKIDKLIKQTDSMLKDLKKFLDDDLEDGESSPQILMTEIALAYLQAHKEGLVLVPVDPTDEMRNAVIIAHRIDDPSMIGVDITNSIRARPKTALDEIIEGIENDK